MGFYKPSRSGAGGGKQPRKPIKRTKGWHLDPSNHPIIHVYFEESVRRDIAKVKAKLKGDSSSIEKMAAFMKGYGKLAKSLFVKRNKLCMVYALGRMGIRDEEVRKEIDKWIRENTKFSVKKQIVEADLSRKALTHFLESKKIDSTKFWRYYLEAIRSYNP